CRWHSRPRALACRRSGTGPSSQAPFLASHAPFSNEGLTVATRKARFQDRTIAFTDRTWRLVVLYTVRIQVRGDGEVGRQRLPPGLEAVLPSRRRVGAEAAQDELDELD